MESLTPTDPEVIAGYQMIARLGEGGMGRVYLAVDPRGGRPVALKVIQSALARQPEFRVRFQREVATAQRVRSPYIAEVVAADPDAESPWLATRYVAGPSVADAVGRLGRLPDPTVQALAVGVAEALTAVQRAGLVHRDIKPANVLLDTTGPVVIDFGIAWAAEASQLTHTGQFIGTPGFMSPEQIKGERLDAAADVFSLGALLTFALTGKGPFGDLATIPMIARVLHGGPDLSAVPPGWRDLIGRCLAGERAQRPSLDAIRATCANGRPVDSLFGPDWLPAELNNFVQQRTMTAKREEGEYRKGRAPVPGTTPHSLWENHQPSTGTNVRERRRRFRPAIVAVSAIAAIAAIAIPVGISQFGDDNPQTQPTTTQTGGGPTVPTTEPTTDAPPDTLPAKFVGSWSGQVHQKDIDKDYTVVATLKSGKIGSVVGVSRYWTLKCSGELVLQSVSESTVEVIERITDGHSFCKDSVPLTFTLKAGGMRYQGGEPAYADGDLDGTLTKAAGELPSAFVGTWRGTLYQANTDENYTVVIVLKNRALGSTGTIDYPPLKCSGTVTLENFDSKTAWFTEKITKNERAPGCIATGIDSVRLTGGNKGTFEWAEDQDSLAEPQVEGPISRS